MITIEPAAEHDLPFAWDLYCVSIGPLARAAGSWSEQDERRLVERSFADAEASLLFEGGERLGWMHVRTTAQAIELWQLFIVPEARGRGLGGLVLARLQAQANAARLPVMLTVLRNNPARRLYERAGLEKHAEDPHHLFLWWRPLAGIRGAETPGGIYETL